MKDFSYSPNVIFFNVKRARTRRIMFKLKKKKKREQYAEKIAIIVRQLYLISFPSYEFLANFR